jgi:hypothetical protein
LLAADPCRLTHDLPERPVRDPLAVREAPPGEDPCLELDRGQELEGQTRFADPGLPDDGNEPKRAFRDGCSKLMFERIELLTAPDQHAGGVTGAPATVG